MVSRCTDPDYKAVDKIINEAARNYNGVIPAYWKVARGWVEGLMRR